MSRKKTQNLSGDPERTRAVYAMELTELGQPGVHAGAMPLPATTAGCPRGLEYLSVLGQVKIIQKMEALEVMTGIEGNNHYTIKNPAGQIMYSAAEGISTTNFVFLKFQNF